MARTLLILLSGAVVGVAGTLLASYYTQDTPGPNEQRSHARQDGLAVEPEATIALGTIEPRDGIVRISSPLVGVKIESVEVREGDQVQAGQLLVALDATAARKELELAISQREEGKLRRQAELDAATQRVSAAELALKQMKDGRELKRHFQESQLAVATAKSEQAQKDLERLTQLQALSEPLASQQQVELQQLVVRGAEVEEESARIALQQLEQTLDFQTAAAELEQTAAQQGLDNLRKDQSVVALDKQVEMAELKLGQTKIHAPTAGTVLSVMARPGEVIAQQLLLQIANLEELVCVAEVDAVHLPRLSQQDAARISGRILGSKTISAHVERIGNIAAQPSLQFADPRQPVDRTVGKVVLTIDSDDLQRATAQLVSLVGLQVEVSIPLTRP